MAHKMWEADRKSSKTILQLLRMEPDAKDLAEDDLIPIVRPFAALELRQTAANLAQANGEVDPKKILEYLRRTTAFHLLGEPDATTIIQLGISRPEGLRTIPATDLMDTEFRVPEWTVSVRSVAFLEAHREEATSP